MNKALKGLAVVLGCGILVYVIAYFVLPWEELGGFTIYYYDEQEDEEFDDSNMTEIHKKILSLGEQTGWAEFAQEEIEENGRWKFTIQPSVKGGTCSVHILDEDAEIIWSWENSDSATGELTGKVKPNIMKKAKYLLIIGNQKGMTGKCDVMYYGKPTLKTKWKRFYNEYFGTEN